MRSWAQKRELERLGTEGAEWDCGLEFPDSGVHQRKDSEMRQSREERWEDYLISSTHSGAAWAAQEQHLLTRLLWSSSDGYLSGG